MKYQVGQKLYPKRDYLGMEENKPVTIIKVMKKGKRTKVDVDYNGVKFSNISVKKFRKKPR